MSMILTANQVEHSLGNQMLEFWLTTNPTSAVVSWDEGTEEEPDWKQKTVPVSYEEGTGKHFIQVYIPAPAFSVKLNTEERITSYETDWRDQQEYESDDYRLLEADGRSLKVPYCDLAKVDVQILDADGQKLKAWGTFKKKLWELGEAEVGMYYGAPTLVINLILDTSIVVKVEKEWKNVDSIEGGYSVEITGLTPIINDPVARLSVCREELYEVKYRRRMP